WTFNPEWADDRHWVMIACSRVARPIQMRHHEPIARLVQKSAEPIHRAYLAQIQNEQILRTVAEIIRDLAHMNLVSLRVKFPIVESRFVCPEDQLLAIPQPTH